MMKMIRTQHPVHHVYPVEIFRCEGYGCKMHPILHLQYDSANRE